MRVSGKGLNSEAVKFPAEYLWQGEGGWEIDTGRIDEKIEKYIEEAAAEEKYSIAGICIALGITRETLELWRSGYVCGEDARDKRTAPNGQLAALIAKGELHVHRYWEESDRSTTLHTKFLENAGVLGGAKQAATQRLPFDLGKLKKFCR